MWNLFHLCFPAACAAHIIWHYLSWNKVSRANLLKWLWMWYCIHCCLLYISCVTNLVFSRRKFLYCIKLLYQQLSWKFCRAWISVTRKIVRNRLCMMKCRWNWDVLLPYINFIGYLMTLLLWSQLIVNA